MSETDPIDTIEDVSTRTGGDRKVPYPVIIKESRYSGAYSHGGWILVAGLQDPERYTEAWGSDTECSSFWREREAGGPAFERQVGNYTREVYAAAGDDPNQLVIEMFQHFESGP